MDIFIFIIELLGVAAFSLSGTVTAEKNGMDFLGTVVLGVLTAVGGGLMRDIIIGKIPPDMFINPVYSITATLTAIIFFVIVCFPKGRKILGGGKSKFLVDIFDTLGLTAFAITGVNTVVNMYGTLGFGFLAVFTGTITAVGGGVLRDICTAKIPVVFRKKLYAVVAILGSIIYYIMLKEGINGGLSVCVTSAVMITLRLWAMICKIDLPSAEKISKRFFG